MDVCTLILPTMITLQACFSLGHCEIDAATQRQFCTSGGQTPCPLQQAYYECVGPDQSTYRLNEKREPIP